MIDRSEIVQVVNAVGGALDAMDACRDETGWMNESAFAELQVAENTVKQWLKEVENAD